MVFELLSGSSRTTGVPDLIARKKYDDALALLKEQLRKNPGDTPLRMQAAEVLALQGRIDNATRILTAVADEYAAQGFAAKAIAVLKKIQKIDPTRRDLEGKIVELFKASAPARSGDFRTWKPADLDHNVRSGVALQQAVDAGARVEPVPAAFDASSVSQFGMQDPDAGPSLDVGAALRDAAQTLRPAAASSVPVAQPVEAPFVVDIEQFTQPAAASGTPAPRVVSPLFDDFSEDELLEVIRGLELLTFEPGDIIVTEGEEGDSLYVMTSGAAKAFVRNRKRGSTQVRQLTEGDFFGEISVLTGKPRSATITAAEPCELLRLDRPTLDSITATRPRVREVLQQFYVERAHNVAESEIRGLEAGTSETLRRAGLSDDPQESAPAAPEAMASAVDANDARAQYLRNSAIEHSRRQNWNDAVQAWQQYLALRPEDTDAGNALGVLFGKLGRWKEAARTFENLAAAAAADATLLFNLGVAYRQLGSLPDAADAWRRALAIKPDYEKASQALASVTARMSQPPAGAGAQGLRPSQG